MIPIPSERRVSEELPALKVNNFKTEERYGKGVLTKLIHLMALLTPLALHPDRNNV